MCDGRVANVNVAKVSDGAGLTMWKDASAHPTVRGTTLPDW